MSLSAAALAEVERTSRASQPPVSAVVMAGGGPVTLDWSSAGNFTVNLSVSGSTTLTFANALPGQRVCVRLVQDTSGSNGCTLPTVTWDGGVSWTIATSANAVDTLYFTALPGGTFQGTISNGSSGGGGSVAIGSAVGSATNGSVLFVAGGNLAQDNSHFSYANNVLTLQGVNVHEKGTNAGNGVVFMAGGGNATASGSNVVAFGPGAGNSLTTASYTFCFGLNAGQLLTTGGSNTLCGPFVGAALTTQTDCTGFGNRTLQHATVSLACAFGSYCGNALTTGTGFSGFGTSCAQTVTTGNNATFFGQGADVSSGTLNNTGAFGQGVVVSTANTYVFGASGCSTVMGGSYGGALATNATRGFLYLPTCAGAPTGTPDTQTGTAAHVFDTTNNKLWVYNGSWKGVVVA
jgi:hypothetical protein